MKPPLLYLVHRLPYPPNKGDKVRSYHLLRQLCRNYRVFLGTFIDLAEDWQHVAAVQALCEAVHVEGIRPRAARVASLRGLLTGEPLSLPYYRSASMRHWVGETIRDQGIRRAVVFSSSMSQYALDLPAIRPVIDFVDVDSAKWTRYADDHTGPIAWLYRREGRLLGEFERHAAARASASVFVSDAEAALFLRAAPGLVTSTFAITNGVDADFFSPEHEFPNPYSQGVQAVVFTGAMDYWPNIDAATWFASEIWPRIRADHPRAAFYIVGMNPTPAVRALAREAGVTVTGTVPDVRPYIRHAKAVVAPLRVARGVQNKILEAMSMGRPVVASSACAQGVVAAPGKELLTAESPGEFVSTVSRLLGGQEGEPIGARARKRALADYSWEAHLARIDELIESSLRGNSER